ncbi:MAG: hypothetical protein FD145_956 [Candidatus Saganbacteria bacterium]|uniref:Uncharacterized protein n=1 Tax=Candidatus Saganbacteria bacterium TaxID=2575572 RepID=A0A833L0U3_UNCSA|nr:MAG: hypothetical protein FD145_956 [Candidatus Saganbacteria bacterium]
MQKKVKLDKKDLEYLKIASKMTPFQTLKWLDEMRKFTIKTIPRQRLRAILKLREAE